MPQLLKPAAFVRPGGQKIRCIANAGVVKHRQLMYRDYLPLLHLRAIGAGFAAAMTPGTTRDITLGGSQMVGKELRLTELSHCAG